MPVTQHPKGPRASQKPLRLSAVAGLGLVVLFWAVQVGVNVWWLQTDTRPPTYDAAGHAAEAVQLAREP